MSLQDVLKAVQDSYEFKKTATVKGIPYGLKVLNVKQEKQVNAAVSSLNDEDAASYIKELRKEILSRSVVEIKGELIPDVVETPDGRKDRALFLKEFLDTLPDVLIEKLFDIYVDLREEAEKAIENDMQYDWFKTPEERNKEYEGSRDDQEEPEKPDDLDSERSEEDKLEKVDLKEVRETEDPEIPPANS
jgi:phosphoribosylformylglycinamidine (FGAM) synthase PurS component